MDYPPPMLYVTRKASLAVLLCASLGLTAQAQDSTYPIDDYTEPVSAETPDVSEWSALPSGLNASWASRDKHYAIREVPDVKVTDTKNISVWKGERANVLAVLYSNTAQESLQVRMTEWTKDGNTTGITAAEARFVNYVITDDFSGCGVHDTALATYLSPDIIDQDKPHTVAAMTTRPVWCTIDVPTTVDAGHYTSVLEIVGADGNVVKSLTLNINVVDKTLPLPSAQTFHLDLWQQPYAVSRYYGVERWSDGHIEALRPYLKALARAGQSVVTTIMFYEPWGEQSHDKFDPMVQTTLKSDGTWSYDYTIFDKYVTLCEECGISKQINCFSMVPWDMSFRYFDESSNSYKSLSTTTSSDDYKSLWTSFLTSFKAHLQEKGWFDKTNIAMDERAEADMLNAYNIANGLGFKVALAGNYHSSLVDKLNDFCVALGQDKKFSSTDLANRKAKGGVTTVYTSCADYEPNIFTNSNPAEATFLPIYAAANNLDGYLHWSFMNWDEHPLTDSRFRKFQSGDTYCYYPGNRSSVRFERLIEGIHQYEKVQILKAECQDNTAKLDSLNSLLSRFTSSTVAGEDCAKYVNDLEAFLNGEQVELPGAQAVKTGYYHIVSKETNRTENIYNDAFLSGNNYKYTLQSDSKVETNNGIWRVTNNGDNTISIVNGDGQPMVAGTTYVGGIAGTFSKLTIADSADVADYRYYYFSEAVNCTNGGNYYKVNGTDYITTWTDGAKTAADLLWRFDPVSLDDRYVYNVAIDGPDDAYITYTHNGTTESAFNGGFFLPTSVISADRLTVGIVGKVVNSADITVEDNVIRVSNIDYLKAPESQDLFNTSKGDGVVPPYRIPGIAQASNGRLIATAARLVCGTDPGYGQVDVVCRTSDDNGATWSEIKEVAVGNGKTSATENYFETAFGDPAVVADRTSQEVLVLAVGGCTLYTSSNTTRSNPNLIALIRSHDNGNTWETPVNVTEDIYSLFDNGNAIEAAFVGGGRVFQSRIVKKGDYYRLYAALCARPNGNRVIYSDDFGATWHALGGATALPAPDGNEPKCDELPDGRVVLTSRASGGRIFNIFTYTNTLEGEGSWGTSAKCTFAGSGLTPGNNSTNGEMLVLPVKRNDDNKDMYLVLQSIPTGSSRTNVGIYYKELTDLSDLNTVENFSKDWNGFCQVSNTASAYSSMEWQADNKIGFFWEETLTGFGQRQNPVTTSFPTGSGTHNFDGFDNLYAPYSLEYITQGAYSINNSVDRGAFLKSYFLAYAEASSLTDGVKQQVSAAANALKSSPTTQEVDAIYQLIISGKEADKWDGKTVTFTNIQQNGDEYTLYIDDNSILQFSSEPDGLGAKAQFLCEKRDNDYYSFYNEDAKLYMIWRAGNNYGYNNNAGTLSSYNATYCNWQAIDASATKDGTYYLVSKRSNGTTDGSFVIMATGIFDSWGNSVAWSTNYSNLFRVDVVDDPLAIQSVERAYRPAVIYDISGRRVENVQRGFYIIDGKKVLVR